jgi:lysophospholipase L1-like esterase
MKRFLLITLGLAMILTAVACNAKKDEAASTEPTGEPTEELTEAPTEEIEQPLTNTEVKIAEHVDDIFRQLGRTYVKDNVLNIDFACGGIEFSAECEGRVQVKINSARDTRFTVYVDGVRSNLRPQVTTSNSGGYFTIASDLPRGEHTFRLISQTQFIWTYGSVESVKLKGNFLPKPADRELYLEFYGDSILNGSGVIKANDGINGSDATQAFGFLTAEMLNADMSLIGCSSIGLTNNTRSFYMKDIWNYAGARYSTFSKQGELLTGIPEWEFSRVPDVIIIEQGANDGSNASKQIFEDAVKEMVNNLRAKYGADVPIVFPIGYSCPDRPFHTTLPRIVEKLGGASANLYVCELSDVATGVPGTDGVHPNTEGAKTMATELTAFLKTILK